MNLSEDVVRDVGDAEAELKKLLAALKRLQTTLKTAKSKLASTEWPMQALRNLLDSLRDQEQLTSQPFLADLVSRLNQKLDSARPEFERAFLKDIQAAAADNHLPTGEASGVRFLGPFELRIDAVRECCDLIYAKQPACPRLPLSAKSVVETAASLSGKLLGSPLSETRLAADFEQAHRIVLVRNRKPLDGRETRSTLPEVFREMQFVRQDANRNLSAKSVREYTLPQFVVELKRLIQSDANLESSKRFRLETAVIENTQNAQKSVFVPTDLGIGYGEGTYFQAMVLVSGGD